VRDSSLAAAEQLLESVFRRAAAAAALGGGAGGGVGGGAVEGGVGGGGVGGGVGGGGGSGSGSGSGEWAGSGMGGGGGGGGEGVGGGVGSGGGWGQSVSFASGGGNVDAFVKQASTAAAALLSGNNKHAGAGGAAFPYVPTEEEAATSAIPAPAGLLRVSPIPGVHLLVPNVAVSSPIALLLFWAPLVWTSVFLLPLVVTAVRELIDELDVVGILVRAAMGAAQIQAEERRRAIISGGGGSGAGSGGSGGSGAQASPTTIPSEASSAGSAALPATRRPSLPALSRLALTLLALFGLIQWYSHVTLQQPWGSMIDSTSVLAARELGAAAEAPFSPVPAASGSPPRWPALIACPILLVAAAHIASVARTFSVGYDVFAAQS
jgi:hypothetical protein